MASSTFAGGYCPSYAESMERRDLTELVQFSSGHVRRETVFETGRLWSQLLCFERNQTMGPAGDDGSDAMFTIVAGEAVFQVDGRRKRIGQWASVLVPAGSKVTVTNASVEPLVVLLVAAPPPVARAVSG
jgi:mannose-6-phosphate isomerase-like protein (cupin superfamily)